MVPYKGERSCSRDPAGAIGVGSAFGGYVGGILTPIMGWRNAFWVIAAISIIGAIIFYAMVRVAPPLEEEEQQQEEVTVEEGDYVETGAVIGHVAEPTKYYSVEGSNVYFKLTKDGEAVNPLDYLG